ncbi:MAG TPA: PSD1 and planctomycete cytochrome C domain-containing protein [Pirellulaceae bacterium]|jgi:hypothetical protein|nr:PSD1 and planctomycete cytochrome C domain-containing protein [Pirellulaceae bacterium]
MRGAFRAFLCFGVCFGLSISFAPLAAGADEPEKASFDRQIRPILSDRCYACHGPDEAARKGALRLDTKEGAFGAGESGATAIVAGDPAGSELVARIRSEDESLRMPPAEAHKPLTAEEVELLSHWVAEGASWSEHWAFEPPKRPEVPPSNGDAFVRGPIDAFVLARLTQEGMTPQAEADRAILLRRVTFDLTGLPPTREEVAAFLADQSPDAYEKVVDRLLGSKAYAEHMTRYWLDAARYGDTHGLHLDNYREMWLYRDWVIDAFDSNMPYDRFVTEQLAGDLLPNATEDQLVATGFNRCHVTTGEGGSITEEVEMRNVVDRVFTTGTVFMGLTMDCTRCHDHKYDPLTQKDYYSFYAFFNNLDGSPLDGNVKDHPPTIAVLTESQKAEKQTAETQLAELRARIGAEVAKIAYVEPATTEPLPPPEPKEFVWIDDVVPEGDQQGGWTFVSAPQPVFSGEKSHTRKATGLSQHLVQSAKTPLKIAEGDVFFTYVYLDPADPPKEIMLQFNDGSWEHRAFWGENVIPWGADGQPSRFPKGALPKTGEWVRLEVTAAEVGLSPGAAVNGWAFTQHDGTTYWDKAGILSKADQNKSYASFAEWLADKRSDKGAGLSPELQAIVAKPEAELSADERAKALAHFVERVWIDSRATFDPLHQQVAALEEKVKSITAAAPTTLIFKEKAAPSTARIFDRGEYDKPKDEVQRAVPAFLPPLPEGAPLNRLGVAQWLVDPSHPLTARVAVNRFWQQFFGLGLVETSEDFGSQGSPPSHPELLDWMAVEFRESGWNVKALLKRIAMSSAYRQSSKTTPDAYEQDPKNKRLARGPRFRMDAEALRDQALSLSGLLHDQVGGPSVKPPQPELWSAVGFVGSNTMTFEPDEGHEKVHRRTLYTFLKRTAPAPQLQTIDAPSREQCNLRRERTNTPLQALLLLNDPQYFEAARALAGRTLKEGGDGDAVRAKWLLETALARAASAEEVAEVVRLVDAQREDFKAKPEDAKPVAEFGGAALPAGHDAPDVAAWTLAANLILNLDEVLTKN